MPILMNKGKQVKMNTPASSIINLSAYQHYRSQQQKKWIAAILLLVLLLILLFSLIFDRTIQAQEAAGGLLSLDAQTVIFKQIVNPVSIILVVGSLLVTGYAAIRYLRLQGICDQALKETLEIQEIETGTFPSGPGFINTGVRNILILKNYQGYLRILRPGHPAQKNLFFFTAVEKVDQTINLQPQHISMRIFCRTMDGIQVLFPSVQIEYRFMVNTPSNNLRTSSGNSATDMEIIKTYLYRKGSLGDQEIIRFSSELVFAQIMRSLSLDALNGETPSREKKPVDEKITRQIESIRRYKINALSKHWRNRKILAERAEVSQKKLRKPYAGRTHHKLLHSLQKSLFTSAVSHENWEASPVQSFSLLEEKLRTALQEKLTQFNILLLSLQVSSWQPVESMVKQKISQNQGKKAELLLAQKKTGNRQIQQAARQAYLDILHEQSLFTSPNQMNHSFSSTDQVLIKAKKYRIPPFTPVKNPLKDKGL